MLGAEKGSYNGAETCGLVGLSMLNRLGTVNQLLIKELLVYKELMGLLQ